MVHSKTRLCTKTGDDVPLVTIANLKMENFAVIVSETYVIILIA
jgi:hypothetical protein